MFRSPFVLLSKSYPKPFFPIVQVDSSNSTFIQLSVGSAVGTRNRKEALLEMTEAPNAGRTHDKLKRSKTHKRIDPTLVMNNATGVNRLLVFVQSNWSSAAKPQ